MPNTKSKTNIIIVLIVLIILGGFLVYYFLKKNNKPKNELENKTEAGAVNIESSSLKKIQNLGEFSQISGEELLGILNLLQNLKLDIDFFQSEKFRNPSDFYKAIEIKDEEKGNLNLFKVQ